MTLTATLLALLAVAGCATGMGRATSQRETVPVAGFNVDADAVFDDAFALNRLRTVDPCAALRSAGLEQWGEPASDSPGDLGSCSNFMKDHNGEQFNASLYLDNDVYNANTHRIGGLPGEVLPEDETCFVRVAYQGSGAEVLGTKHGMQIQLLSDGAADPCSAAVQIMTRVVDTIRTDPPIGDAAGSIASYDPCAMLNPVEARDALAGATAPAVARGLFRCSWSPENGVSATVRFESGRVETGRVPPIDLGGKPGSVLPGAAPGTCRVQWENRGNINASGDDEFAEVSISNAGPIPMDPCANAIGAARAARAKLPQG